MTVKAFDFRYVSVLSFLLGNNIDTCGRVVGVTTLSPSSSAAPETSLVVPVLVWIRGSLLSRRGLFSTGRVSREGVGGLILLLKSLCSFLAGPFPLEHLESMSRVLAED